MRLRLFAICCLLCATAVAATEMGPAQSFASGMQRYQAGDYPTAVHYLEQAVSSDPTNSEYYHWLGNAYGRLARESSWIRAIALVRKTRAAFERAVELDPDNADALDDLINFYRSAPAFLGGDPAKADRLARRLARLERHDKSVQ